VPQRRVPTSQIPDIDALADNLHQLQAQAAKALRQIMPMQRGLAPDGDLLNGEARNPRPSGNEVASRLPITNTMESPASSVSTSLTAGAVSAANVVKPICLSPGASVSASPEAGAASDLVPSVQRLVEENSSLREAFHDANRRISHLEEEKSRFFDEGVFELVNSVCGAPPGSAVLEASCENLVARLQGLASEHGTRPSPACGTSEAPPASSALSPTSDTAPALSAFASEGDQRSDALSGENAELRRELMRASELGEALEQQQRVAEDRMHKLEGERTWLAQRLSQCVAAVDFAGPRLEALDGGTGASLTNGPSLSNGGPAASLPEGGGGAGASGMPDFDMRRQLQEMNRVLRAELHSDLLQTPEVTDDTPSATSATGRALEASPSSELRRKALDAEKAATEQERILLEEEKTKLSNERARLAQEVALAEERAKREASERGRLAQEVALAAERAQREETERRVLSETLREAELRADALAEENAQLQEALSPVKPREPDSVHYGADMLPSMSDLGVLDDLPDELGALDELGSLDDDLLMVGLPSLPDFLDPTRSQDQQDVVLDLDEAW